MPRKGSVPDNRMWRRTPADHTSTGFPYCCFSITSGAMKWGVPTRPAKKNHHFKHSNYWSKEVGREQRKSSASIFNEISDVTFEPVGSTLGWVKATLPLTTTPFKKLKFFKDTFETQRVRKKENQKENNETKNRAWNENSQRVPPRPLKTTKGKTLKTDKAKLALWFFRLKLEKKK